VNAKRTHQVKDVSRIAGVSVRTLHYYEEIGLLVPAARTEAGYRLYTDDDLLRLQQILIGRELGLPLEQIRRSLDDPAFDRKRALIQQRRQLQDRAAQTAAMISAIDAALAVVNARNRGGAMEHLFQGFDPAKFEAEAKERWGDTDAYKASARRTKGYTTEDWARHRADQQALYADAAALIRRGASPSSEEAMAVAERHRLLIDRWFYPCDRNMHVGLASLYESDARFSDGMNVHTPGLAAFLVAAIRANADISR
jgi:DNA-binding transcriptional MerR regulator